MSHELDLEDALELLADEYARAILEALSGETLSAAELTDACDFSRVTVYRRLDQLAEAGLVSVGMEVDADGHHRRVYRNALEQLTLSVCGDGFEGEVSTGTEPPSLSD